MVTRFGLAAHVPVDAGSFQSESNRRAEEKVIQPETRIPGPPVSEIAPEGVHRIVRVVRPQRIGPTGRQELRIGRAGRRLQQRVVLYDREA